MKEFIFNLTIILFEIINIVLGITNIVISFTTDNKDILIFIIGCIIIISYIILFGKTIYRIVYNKAIDNTDIEIAKLNKKIIEINNVIDEKNKLINKYIVQYGAITNAE